VILIHRFTFFGGKDGENLPITQKIMEKRGEYFWRLKRILYLCTEMDEWWGFDKPFFCS
jgi:hypothetical protein